MHIRITPFNPEFWTSYSTSYVWVPPSLLLQNRLEFRDCIFKHTWDVMQKYGRESYGIVYS